MVRKHKKGYIKTIEAVIAIVGILLFTFGVTPKEISNPNEVPFIVDNAQNFIITELQQNEVLRQEAIDTIVPTEAERKEALFTYDASYVLTNASLTTLVENNLPVGYTYEFKMCVETTCLAYNPPFEASVYSDDTVIAGLSGGESKAVIFRLWLWRPVALTT